MIASRNHITSQFLKKGDVDDFDISSSDNDLKKMHQNQYQNHLRQLFCDEQERGNHPDKLYQFKKKDEKLLQKEAPAHVLLRILWLTPRDFCCFEYYFIFVECYLLQKKII